MSDVIFNYVIDKFRRLHFSPFNRLAHVGTYVRELPVSLERMYENALDGEHLPYLHSSTFSYLKILDSGPWGWRARANLYPRSFLTEMEIKLELNREEYCWKTVTLSGLGKGTEIWTHAIPLGEQRIKVIVDFYVPKVPPPLKSLYEDYYLSTYERLYDEDLQMMSQRQQALDLKQQRNKPADAEGVAPNNEAMRLGNEIELRAQLPFSFDFNQHRYCLNQVEGELIVYSAQCPHMLAPLQNEPVNNGVIECPWHGYRFKVTTGRCVSGQSCRLKTPPEVLIDPDTRDVFVR